MLEQYTATTDYRTLATRFIKSQDFASRTEFYTNTRNPQTDNYNAFKWIQKIYFRARITSFTITNHYV